MSNPNVGIQGRNSTGKLKPVLTDDSGRLVIVANSDGIMSLGNTIDTSAAAYAAGDTIGANLTSINIAPEGAAGANRVYEVASLSIVDTQNKSGALDILFFNADPAVLGAQTDNAPFDWSGGLPSAFIGKVGIVAADYETINGVAVATVNALGLLVPANLVGSIFAAVVAQAATAYGAHAAALYLQVGIKRV